MNFNNISNSLKEIIGLKKGYRNENYGGSRVTDAEEVITFEMCELQNTDIPEFIKENYIKDLFPDNIESDQDELSDYLLDNLDDIVNSILYYCASILSVKKEDLTALWLTTNEGVRLNYSYDEDIKITEYIIPDKYVVVSDLEDQGSLFITTKHTGLVVVEQF